MPLLERADLVGPSDMPILPPAHPDVNCLMQVAGILNVGVHRNWRKLGRWNVGTCERWNVDTSASRSLALSRAEVVSWRCDRRESPWDCERPMW
jgi:hypothetical protein